MQAGEQPERSIPRQLADDGRYPRVACETAAQVGVERRPPLAVARLVVEDAGLVSGAAQAA